MRQIAYLNPTNKNDCNTEYYRKRLKEQFDGKELSDITELNLSGLKLQILPESLTSLTNLKELNLSRNNLTNLPQSFKNLLNLEILCLDSNKLTYFPDCFKDLTLLHFLDLHRNELKILPNWFGRLPLKNFILPDDQSKIQIESSNGLHSLIELKYDQHFVDCDIHLTGSELEKLKKFINDLNQDKDELKTSVLEQKLPSTIFRFKFLSRICTKQEEDCCSIS